MATLTKITRNYQVTIPPAARRALKLKVGDYVEATPQRDGVLLRPAKVATPDAFEKELRRQLAEGLADIKAGRLSGPFESVKDLFAHVDRQAKPRRARRHKKPARR